MIVHVYISLKKITVLYAYRCEW